MRRHVVVSRHLPPLLNAFHTSISDFYTPCIPSRLLANDEQSTAATDEIIGMSQVSVKVSVNGTDIFIDYGDGSILPPNAAERMVAGKALIESLDMLDKPAMDEICRGGGEVGEKLKPKPGKFRLRLVR